MSRYERCCWGLSVAGQGVLSPFAGLRPARSTCCTPKSEAFRGSGCTVPALSGAVGASNRDVAELSLSPSLTMGCHRTRG